MAQNGWNDDQTWGRRVQLPGSLAGSSTRCAIEADAGGTRDDDDEAAARVAADGCEARRGGRCRRALPASIVRLDNSGGASFAVSKL
jgi:hypothetical protein